MNTTRYICVIVDLDNHEPVAFRVDGATSPAEAWDRLSEAFDADEDFAIDEYDKAACLPLPPGASEDDMPLYGSSGEPLTLYPMPGSEPDEEPDTEAPGLG